MSAEDIAALAECCLPHPIVGTTNANLPQGSCAAGREK